MNLERTPISPTRGTKKGEIYFTLVAGGMSMHKAVAMALNLRGKRHSEPQLWIDSGYSSCSHIHDSNRNRIALHVALNDSRNSTRRRW